jgi:tape measure domain-containing protein
LANDSADFSVRLHDELTGPARAMRDELKGLLGDLKKVNVGIRVPRQQREKRATDGLRAPKMITPNDRIRMQDRAEAAERKARDRADREQSRSQKAAERSAAQERRQQERNLKAQERDSSRLRALMARDEKARLSSLSRQDKAYMRAARDQERMQARVVRERERVAKKATADERSRAAFLAHKKVLDGGVGAEVKGMLAGRRGGDKGAGSVIAELGESLLSKSGLKALAAGGIIAAGVALIANGLTAIKDAAIGAAMGVASLVQSFASASLEALRFAQSSEMALGNLLHGGQNARQEFDAVRGMAEKLGLDVQDTVHSFQKLLAAQFDVGRAKELLAMGSDLQGIGAKADEVSRALLAITQIKSKGRLMASEMLQLQEAGISSELVYEALGKRLGKTRQELAKLQEAGKIDSGIGIDAILEAVRKKTGTTKAGELGEKVARETIDGMVRVLRAGVENMFTDIGRTLEPIVMPIAKRVIGLFDVVRNHKGLKVFGEILVSRLQRVADWIETNWTKVEGVLVAGLDMAANAGLALISVADYIVDHWGEIGPMLKTVGILAGSVALNIGILGVAFASALAPILIFWKIVSKIVGAMESMARFNWSFLRHLPGMQAIADEFKVAPKQAAPETKGVAEPGSLKAALEALRTGPIANDNEKPWWAEKTGAGSVQAVRAEAGASESPNMSHQTVRPVSVNPYHQRTQGPAVATVAAPKELTESASLQLQAARLQLQAAQAQRAAAASGGGGNGESDLAGMLEAI